MGEWIKPDKAKVGTVYLAWVDGSHRPFYRLLERRKARWLDYSIDNVIPVERINSIMLLPEPPAESKD
jgi:hypothetical protein